MHASGSLYESELVGVFGREAVRFLVAKAECSPPGLRYTEAWGEKKRGVGTGGGALWESSRLCTPALYHLLV